MKLFEVKLTGRTEMLIEAKDAAEAHQIAIEGALLRYPELWGWTGTPMEAPAHIVADFDKGLVKSESKLCEYCGANQHRECMGAGWIRCYHCGNCSACGLLPSD